MGVLEVTLTSTYSNQLSTGKLTKVFSVGLNVPGGTSGNYTSQIYDNTNYYTSVYGALSSQWGIEGINFNTTTGQYYITIAHRVSTGNGIRVTVKAYGFSSDYLDANRFGGLSAGSVYTTDTTAFDAPVIEMTGLDLHEVSGVDNKLRFHNSTTGYGTSNGSRIGLNGAELFINNIENSAIKIYTQSTQTNGITILGDGNVGIGVTDPITYKLEVAGPIYSSQYYATNTSSSFQKLSVYGNGGTYGIGMVAGITYGALNDWAMTFRFNSESDRGFWWGDTSHSTAQGAMSLTTNGYLTVARRVKVGGGEADTSGLVTFCMLRAVREQLVYQWLGFITLETLQVMMAQLFRA